MENKKQKTEKKTQKLIKVVDEFEKKLHLLMRLIILDHENKETKKVKKNKKT